MTSSTRYALIALCLCAIGLGIWFARPKQLTDTQQIQSQIQAAVSGANRHSIGAILPVISSSYTDENGMDVDKIRALLAEASRNYPEIDVTMSNPIIVLNGNKAESDSTLIVRDAANGDQVIFAHPLHLTWQKENSLSLFMFPTKTWRVVSASYGEVPEGYE